LLASRPAIAVRRHAAVKGQIRTPAARL
jgi:hypothetical protein